MKVRRLGDETMKIAMLGVKAVPAIGGIARYVEELGSRLAERGHEVTVYCRPHYMGDDNGKYYKGMKRIVTRGLKGKHLDALTHTFTAALHALRQDYDILHIHGCGPGVVAPLLSLRKNARIVLTIHGLDWQRAKWSKPASWLMYKGAAFSIRWCHKLVAVGGHIRDFYREQWNCEIEVIPTGVNLPHLPAPKLIHQLGLKQQQYIFCAARFVPEKGLHYLLDAFNSLDTDMKLVIAGDWAYEDEYVKRLLASRNGRVVFPGYVKGRLLAELYAHCYVYVQPSLLEGLSISVLEALSYGCCVLASDIPANLEALGPCGYTFKAGDTDSLREQLSWLLTHPDDVQAEFEKARSYIARERNWDITADRYEALYLGLLGREAVQERIVEQSQASTVGQQHDSVREAETRPGVREHV